MTDKRKGECKEEKWCGRGNRGIGDEREGECEEKVESKEGNE